MGDARYFSPGTFTFLKELARNNDRDWFQEHRSSYEEKVRDPAVRFILDFAPHLKKISPHFRADPRTNGGSLFRIHRDTRFSKDKSPYKTHTGIQFRHEAGKDAHAPGFYVHLEPGGCFVGVGIWRPDGATLRRIREHMVNHPEGWKKAVGGKAFREGMTLGGERLARPPRGFDPEHPLAEDLRLKDFVGMAPVPEKTVTGAGFPEEVARLCRAGAPLVAFLCGALDLPY